MISSATKFKLVLGVLVTSSVLTGCMTDQLTQSDSQIVYKTRVVNTTCQDTKIISVSRDDRMTDQTWKEILAHNKAWMARCGKK